MKVYKTSTGILIDRDGSFYLIQHDWDSFVNRKNLHQKISDELKQLSPDPAHESLTQSNLQPPVGGQEIWASGVTYLRSKEARMEEAKNAGGGDFYAKVYEAERPELFFKAAAWRVVGDGGTVRIRKDSKWNVPEPELTLFMCSEGTIEGYTVGNDMSSRDIEGENPLYLPQAKVYDGSASIGPCLYVPGNAIDADTNIKLTISRGGAVAFTGDVSINRMKRKHDELARYLFMEMSFPQGAYLMTGTGLVPPDHFSLSAGDQVEIAIDGIGTLRNIVE